MFQISLNVSFLDITSPRSYIEPQSFGPEVWVETVTLYSFSGASKNKRSKSLRVVTTTS